MFRNLIKVALFAAVCSVASGADEPSDPSKQTKWKLYQTSKEAYEMKQNSPDTVLFIDVRDPVEIMFTGFTDVVDINIPFKLANRKKWNDKKQNFAMETNPNFEAGVAEALEARGLSKEVPIIIMCRSGGTRGAPCANTLWGKGYSKVYVVTDGFQGVKSKELDSAGKRIVNGWKNSGLPWSFKLNKAKIYQTNN